jgi:DNA-directed RNA polymerase specialized sigma24 family protein
MKSKPIVMKAQFTNQCSPSSGYQNDLIEACKRGDHKAQLMVYKLYCKPVYNICLQIVNDPAVAEDIMHESFLSAFENISSYCGDTSFSSWLNKFISYTI